MAKILIADPHPDLAALFARMVARLGHEPVEDGAAPFDAAIVDIDSPSGSELARSSRRRGRPVVCVGIYTPVPATCADIPGPYLLKPFPMKALGAALANVLESRRALELA